MFVLTLTFTDPEDATYFTNKTVNKLHGYMRHQHCQLALFFTTSYIKIYAEKEALLTQLLQNKAICFDIERHIFNATLSPVQETHLTLYTRTRETITNVHKIVNQQINYYQKNFHHTNEALKNKKKALINYYKQKQSEQEKQHRKTYIIINNNHKTFTLWLKVIEIKTSDFPQQKFNSYGLVRLNPL